MTVQALDRLLYEGEKDGERFSVGDSLLMGTWEVARYLGIEKSRIARWLDEIARGKTPIAPPHCRTKAGPHWLLPQVRDKAKLMYVAELGREPTSDAQLDKWLAKRRSARAERDGRLIAA